MSSKKNILLSFLLFLLIIPGFAQDPNFHIYLCFGQSNMEGVAAIEDQDRVVEDRIKVMGAVDCSQWGNTHQVGQWESYHPPVVRCTTGLSPADYFARTMTANLPSNINIGIVPVAIGGADIALFDKDNYTSYLATASTDIQGIVNNFYGGNPYGRLVEIAKLAQKDGVIKGILMHQGEANTGQTTWPGKVKAVYDNLIADLGLDPVETPLLVGEVLTTEAGGWSGAHNDIIATVPGVIPNSHVISASGLTHIGDRTHFNSASVRTLGERYAQKMLTLLSTGIVNSSLTYLDIYTDNSSMINGTWGATITEESNAGAIEGIKDYLISYTFSGWWGGLGLNISNWSDAQAKDFSGYDNLQISYLGTVGSGNASISLATTSGGTASVSLPAVSSYTTLSIPLSSFTGGDLSKVTELDISFGGIDSGSGTLRIDNIKVTTNSSGATGTILREYWTGISGTAISNLTSSTNYPNSPSGSEQLTSLEGPTNWADNYGTRIRGYIHPTTSGSYTFWVAGDDNTDFYLSSDANPSNTTRIAYVSGWTNSKEWNKFSTQQSAAINLTAGQKYYIEVLHKEGSGGDNVAVAWQGPGITQQVIDGSYLSPFVPMKSAMVEPGISSDEEENLDNVSLYPNPTSDGMFNITFHGIKGNVTIGIYDIQGKLVYKQSATGKEHMLVNTKLVKGLYLVKVQSDTSAITRRLVVK